MRKLKTVFAFIFIAFSGIAQKQTYDLVNFSMPKGWDRTEQPNGIQLATKDDGKRTYAAAIIIRSVQTTASPDENFNASWESLVKGTVKISEAPTMFSLQREKGWDIVSGQARYTDGGNKGLITLLTATGNGRMANVVILTNTDKYQNEIAGFLNSLEITETANPPDIGTTQAPGTNGRTSVGSKNLYSIPVPPTWSLNTSGNNPMLEKNTATGKRLIEFMPAIQSSGSLEKDMEHIFFEVFEGWSLANSSSNDLLFEKGDHEKGLTCQGLPYYKLKNAIKKGNGDVIDATVLLIQIGSTVAIINSADKVLGSETDMAFNFLLFNLVINGVIGKDSNYPQQLTGTWAAGSGGMYGISNAYATSYSADGKYYVLAQSSTTTDYGYYYDLIKTKNFKSEGIFKVNGNVLERKAASGSGSKYFIRFYSRKYGNRDWENVMGMYPCDYDKNKIESVFPFHKI